MNITIFYFSGTGNTKYVCEKFKSIMETKNIEVCLYDIETIIVDNNLLNNAKIIGFAYPIYGANIPNIVKKFINELPKNISKDTFILSTVGYINAYGPFIIRRLLKNYNLLLKWHYVYKAINNTKNDKVNQEILNKTFEKQEKHFIQFCDSIISNKKAIKGIGPWIFGGYLVRRIFHNKINDFYKYLYIDMGICKQCYICVNNCPTKSIKYENESFHFLENCTTCYRCINKCPVNAIRKNA